VIEGLVVNGCSYMDVYALGHGHLDLSKKLNIPKAESLTYSGCSNSRIIRTTLKHSYITQQKNFYVLGMTFIGRSEVPILRFDDTLSFEGRWTNPQNQMFQNKWEHHWTEKDTERFVELKLKEEVFSVVDRTEDLMYRLLSLIESLESRGHRILIYQQADTTYFNEIDNSRLSLYKTKNNFINGFMWNAIQWQHSMGVPVHQTNYDSEYGACPEDMKHRAPGYHQKLNEFLTNYIKEYKILE